MEKQQYEEIVEKLDNIIELLETAKAAEPAQAVLNFHNTKIGITVEEFYERIEAVMSRSM